MNQKNLNTNQIFAIPVGDYFGKTPEDLQLVYSPFTENMFVARPDFVELLNEEILFDKYEKTTQAELLESLVPEGEINDYLHKGVLEEGFNTLLVLPNNICNFSCSYCYSALGRSGKKLTKEMAHVALTDFIHPEKNQHKKIFISILGGGEPLMTWELTRYMIELAYELADKYGFSLWMSLVTNGSILNDEMIGVFKKYQIRIAVSFEILEEIQNLQRGQFDKVDANIRKLITAGVEVRIRSTITKDNVMLQKQMVQAVAERYPAIRNLVMEEVTDENHFKTAEDLRSFYKLFLHNFNEAFVWGEQHEIGIECSSFRNNNLLIDRFCPGVLALTPEGEYSVCSRISSPNDHGYEESIFGRIDNSTVKTDKEKLTDLINGYNLYSRPECSGCFTKWHCGGGCYAHQFVYNQKTLEAICDYKREFTRLRLLRDLDADYRQSQGVGLKEFVLASMGSTGN
ncbi:MAG: radical SAM protein [Bacteroidales bacterium]|nr:radical SAM protein [Bacteroidales bacterium]